MRAYERLLKYVKYNTASSDESGATPSTDSQFELARVLAAELEALGASEVYLSDKCYLTAKIPATSGLEDKAPIGFIAHMDTSPDFSAENVNPIIHENYQGGDIPLSDSGYVIEEAKNPHLKNLIGCDIITTDGKTLLGADDKAGIAEIMTAVEELIKSGAPHGPISIGFTPDEEIGAGADYFDVEGFGAKYAYTVDGSAENFVEFENFNAASASVTVFGTNIHPGTAKDKMKNAMTMAMEFHGQLPKEQVPEKTEGYEGFFHLTDMEGCVENAKLFYIIRDHDMDKFQEKKALMAAAAEFLNRKYGEGTVVLTVRDSYFNMRKCIEPCIHIVEKAKQAMRAAGMEPVEVPVRGGTDGARLSYMGLPCPNLCTGGENYHGRFEYIPVEDMEQCVKMLLEILMA
jgi:tripeptide aminopeptidase